MKILFVADQESKAYWDYFDKETFKDIDLIVGGHTHTFLDKPTVLLNAEGKEVIINQVGCYGVRVGRIDFHFDFLILF